MLLARLAEEDDDLIRSLADTARVYCGYKLDKSDVFRTRYEDTIGTDWTRLDKGFFSYAIKDAVTT